MKPASESSSLAALDKKDRSSYRVEWTLSTNTWEWIERNDGLIYEGVLLIDRSETWNLLFVLSTPFGRRAHPMHLMERSRGRLELDRDFKTTPTALQCSVCCQPSSPPGGSSPNYTTNAGQLDYLSFKDHSSTPICLTHAGRLTDLSKLGQSPWLE